MKLYDHLMQKTEALLSGLPGRRWAFDSGCVWPDTGENELVLLRDAAYELGGSGHAAVGGLFVTDDSALVARDEVVLFGPDLQDIRSDNAYARLAFVRVGELGAQDDALYRAIRDIDFTKYHVFPRGYMTRASAQSRREQVRVGRQALDAGIGFSSVGSGFIQKYRENPNVLAVRLVFVTDPGADFSALAECAKKADDITGALNHFLEGIPTDCHSCSLKPVCDEVEGMRELHFKNARSLR